MRRGLAGTEPEAHFQGLTTGIVICDRYSAYKKLARTMGFLLAFCWAHVRRDFLTLAHGYPEQEAWAMTWVAHIGTLYALNNQRLAATEDRESFGQREIALHAHLQSTTVTPLPLQSLTTSRRPPSASATANG